MVKSNFFSEKAPAELTTAAAQNPVCTHGGFCYLPEWEPLHKAFPANIKEKSLTYSIVRKNII